MRFFISIFLIAFSVVTSNAQQLNPADEPFRRIDIWGSAEIEKPAKWAEIAFDIRATGTSPSDVTARLAEQSDAAIAVLEGTGVAADDIETSQLSLNQLRSDQGQLIEEYEARYSVNARINSVDDILGVFQGFVDAGMENYGRISFFAEISLDESAQLSADAFNDATEKARFNAEGAGMKLGAPIVIENQGESITPITEGAKTISVGGFDYEASSMASGSIPLVIPMIRKSASVQIRYELLLGSGE